MKYIYDDGGRAEAGFKGKTGDCCCRAIAIATGMPYKDAYDLINEYAKRERVGTRKRSISNARTGVYNSTLKKIMASLAVFGLQHQVLYCQRRWQLRQL